MSTRAALKSGTSPFAHLARPPKAADGDDDTKKKDDAAKKAKADDEDDDDTKKDDKKKDDAKKAKKAKADDGDGKDSDDDDSADEDDDDTKKDDKKKDDAKKAKKAKADDGDGDADADDMEDEEQDKDARAARARERSRIRAILVSEPGKANPVAAAHLATGTSMPRGQAIEMLAAMQAGQSALAAEPKRDDLRSRMADVPNPVVGTEGSRPAPDLAAQIIAAGKKRRGEA